MPVEPTPTGWDLEPAPDEHPHDLWVVGADLEPGTVLAGYRLGLFPMHLPNPDLGRLGDASRLVVTPGARRLPARRRGLRERCAALADATRSRIDSSFRRGDGWLR